MSVGIVYIVMQYRKALAEMPDRPYKKVSVKKMKKERMKRGMARPE